MVRFLEQAKPTVSSPSAIELAAYQKSSLGLRGFNLDLQVTVRRVSKTRNASITRGNLEICKQRILSLQLVDDCMCLELA